MIAVRMVLVLTALTGFVYPLALTGLAKLVFPRQATGSLIVRDGKVDGSELIGRHFDDPRYFWPRPSATSPTPYNAASSSGSNLGPSNPDLKKAMDDRRSALQSADPANRPNVPADLLTASGSGLDPHISPEGAMYQVARVAQRRGVAVERVEELVRRRIEGRQWGFLGDPVVNVVLLNADLDR